MNQQTQHLGKLTVTDLVVGEGAGVEVGLEVGGEGALVAVGPVEVLLPAVVPPRLLHRHPGATILKNQILCNRKLSTESCNGDFRADIRVKSDPRHLTIGRTTMYHTQG